MKKVWLPIAIFLVSTISATEVEFVPYGGTVMVDGMKTEKTWIYPASFETGLSNRVAMWLIQDSGFVYICLKDLDTTHTGIDLYLDDMNGNRRLLHVSTALGEKKWQDSSWSDFEWGANSFWTANVIQSIYRDGKMEYLAPECFEFQISKAYFPARTFKIMVHLKPVSYTHLTLPTN